MLQIIDKGKFREILSTEGYVHKLNSDMYFKKGVMLPSNTIEDYEEVLELPTYNEELYKLKVLELISRKYSISDEIAIINNARDNSEKHIAELEEYLVYRDKCKAEAKNPNLYNVEV